MITNTADTIVAIATALGMGGVGVVRLSGVQSRAIAEALTTKPLPAARLATLRTFYAADQHIIDHGLLLYFPAPHSYTGEDVVECQIHGSPAALSALLEACLAHGARLAEAGEFTRRAFLHGKLALCTAEAVADLIHASTQKAARSAAQSLSGAFSHAIEGIGDQIIELRALLEAGLDFADEDIDFISRDDVVARIQRLIAECQKVHRRAQQGLLLADGVRCVIVGAPNVGKSSLLNALAEEEAAIVTDIPGTTRDTIERTLVIQGIPFHIVDTAGLRATTDRVEQMGIARTHAAIRQAELLIHLQALDESGRLTPSDAMINLVEHKGARLQVVNKWDWQSAESPNINDDFLPLSVHQGFGLESLKTALLQSSGWHESAEYEPPFSARRRHLQALTDAEDELIEALTYAQTPRCEEPLIAESLRQAHRSLQSITGEYGVEDLLGDIFGRFCIGK